MRTSSEAPPDLLEVPFVDFKAHVRAIRPEIDAAVARVLDSGWFILGPEGEAFERELAEYAGAREAVGVANGTEAIQLALEGLEVVVEARPENVPHRRHHLPRVPLDADVIVKRGDRGGRGRRGWPWGRGSRGFLLTGLAQADAHDHLGPTPFAGGGELELQRSLAELGSPAVAAQALHHSSAEERHARARAAASMELPCHFVLVVAAHATQAWMLTLCVAPGCGCGQEETGSVLDEQLPVGRFTDALRMETEPPPVT